MKETRVSFNDLLPHQKEQVRTLLASAGGNPGGDIVEIVILTRPFNEEILRPFLKTPHMDVGGDCPDGQRLSQVLPNHPLSRIIRDEMDD